MGKKPKFADLKQVFRLLDGFHLLFRSWVLAVILIVCIPPRYDWHVYCLIFGMPLLLISLVLPIWRAVEGGTGFAYHTEEDKSSNGYE
jgi:hypothetical protein